MSQNSPTVLSEEQHSEQKINFQKFNLPSPLMQALAHINYSNPTPIQQKTIPLALDGKDIIGSAQTGTGKTAAFIIPILAQIIQSDPGTALIVTPTRELAMQIIDFTHKLLAKQRQIRTVLLIGGKSIDRQISQLRIKPRLIIGTPGRINDHITRRTLQLKSLKFFVLDEMDCMLDMGFGHQIESITQHLPTDRQTLMFSATLPPSIEKLANQYLHQPVRISVGSTQSPALNIQQDVMHVTQAKKYSTLLEELDKRTGSILIFAKTKIGTERLVEKLKRANHFANFLHGGLTQNGRDRVMKGFKNNNFRIMVATDVAARGLDISNIAHVINYDLPQCPEDYIHRIGRTARAGASGSALCLVSSDESVKWRNIERFLNRKKAVFKKRMTTHKAS